MGSLKSEYIKIGICIATCKRPILLKNLLEKINELNIKHDYRITIAIADNDPNKSAEELVTGIKNSIQFPIKYAHEKKRGIPFTRNRAFSLLEEDTNFVVFIDDDEYPDKNWLINLLTTQEKTNADLVQGPSIPEYVENNPPSWIVKGKFLLFEHYNLKEGETQPFDRVATNNLLVKYDVIKKLDGPFNEKMGLIGCDDTELGLNLNDIGCKMVFTPNAIAFEYIPKERTNFKWIMQRNYRSANTFWLLCRKKNFKNFTKFFLTALLRILIGSILSLPFLIIFPIIGIHHFYKMIRLIVRGYAILNGLFGRYYEEYKVAYTHE